MERQSGITSPRGFTLLEILLVVAAIAILAGIVIVAINPARQLGDTRNAQRRSDVNAIASAIAQYYIRTGSFPETLPEDDDGVCAGKAYNAGYGICAQDATCGSGYSLESSLTPDYMVAIPQDPSVTDATYSGYVAFLIGSQRIRVCSPLAESATISLTR